VCPDWLNPLARAEFERLISELGHVDLLKATDQAALEAYCVAYARWRSAEEIVDREGQTVREPVVTRSGNISGYRTKKHPAVTVAKDERASMLAAGRLFGLSPASRSSLHAPAPERPAEDNGSDDDLYAVN